MDAAVAAVVRSLGSHVDRADKEYLDQTVRDLLIAKRDLMDQLVNDLDAYLVDLSELEVGNRRLIAEIDQFADFIDEHVLWIRSADALRLHDIVRRGPIRCRAWPGPAPGWIWPSIRDSMR